MKKKPWVKPELFLVMEDGTKVPLTGNEEKTTNSSNIDTSAEQERELSDS
ncbi:MAG: hypothetical protein MJ116_06320 [Lachnospiraceae bacterium]|nr:hypothetical protein [Lachnospiraceae bacterium]